MMKLRVSDDDLLRQAHTDGLLTEYLQDPDEVDTDKLMQLMAELERDKLVADIMDNGPEMVINAIGRLGWSEDLVETMCLREVEIDE